MGSGDGAVCPLCHQINAFQIPFITAQIGKKKTHHLDPSEAMLTHKSQAPDWSLPQKQTVTLF